MRGPLAKAKEECNVYGITSIQNFSGVTESGMVAKTERTTAFERIGRRFAMLTEYIDEALHRARYELIEDDETPYYGEIPELPGVWASGRTLEACRQELKEVIEGWIIVSVRRSLDVPRLRRRDQ